MNFRQKYKEQQEREAAGFAGRPRALWAVQLSHPRAGWFLGLPLIQALRGSLRYEAGKREKTIKVMKRCYFQWRFPIQSFPTNRRRNEVAAPHPSSASPALIPVGRLEDVMPYTYQESWFEKGKSFISILPFLTQRETGAEMNRMGGLKVFSGYTSLPEWVKIKWVLFKEEGWLAVQTCHFRVE